MLCLWGLFQSWSVCCAGKHLVLYEDGDKEWLNLTAERVEWEQEEQPDAAEAEVSDPAAQLPSAPAQQVPFENAQTHSRACSMGAGGAA